MSDDKCPSCGRPRAGSLESVGNPVYCWRSDEYCTQYERDTKPFRERIAALESELAAIKGKRFPVLGGGMTVPWQMLEPHEPQALANHSNQTLSRLAERGGLGWAELLCVLESRRWRCGSELTDEQAKPLVLARVAEYEAAWVREKGGGK